jgi:hypothetical protein
MKKSLRNQNFKQKNRNVKKNQQIISFAESLQLVRKKTTNQTIKQIASIYAIEIEITSADKNRDAKHFVLMNELENQIKMINQVKLVINNQLISEKHNSLILNYSRFKIRHNYKQLHRKNFVKSAKIELIKHDLIILKTFEQIINDSQTKK